MSAQPRKPRVPCIYAPKCQRPGARLIYTRKDGTDVCKCEQCYQQDLAHPWGTAERDYDGGKR